MKTDKYKAIEFTYRFCGEKFKGSWGQAHHEYLCGLGRLPRVSRYVRFTQRELAVRSRKHFQANGK